MTPADIRTRIAASDGSDQGEIIRNAFKFLIPQPLDKYWEGSTLTREYKAWNDLDDRIYAMIHAEAHESAALLIADAVLPGWRLAELGQNSVLSDEWKAGFVKAPSEGQKRAYSAGGTIGQVSAGGEGHTLALAIIDAVCAAVEKG